MTRPVWTRLPRPLRAGDRVGRVWPYGNKRWGYGPGDIRWFTVGERNGHGKIPLVPDDGRPAHTVYWTDALPGEYVAPEVTT